MDWFSVGIIVLMVVLLSVVQGRTQVAPYTKNCMTAKKEQAEGERLIRNKADLEDNQERKKRRDLKQKETEDA